MIAEYENGMYHVEFDWSTDKGWCYECACPAAFRLVAYNDKDSPWLLRCAICAANAAADGEYIERIP